MLTPASAATSSRRRPGVRRRPESRQADVGRLQRLSPGPQESTEVDVLGHADQCAATAGESAWPRGTRIEAAFLPGAAGASMPPCSHSPPTSP